MIRIYACSSNAGKLRDFKLVASEAGFSDFLLEPLPDLKNIEAPEETGTTFEENASLKALYYSRFVDEIVLADDSGIAVDALGGAPGVHSARYAGTNASDEANNDLLLENMVGKIERSARFVCAIALAQQGRILHSISGTVNGEILPAPRGKCGFGYDPLFFYPPFALSFGEIEDARKFGVSHRGEALRQLIQWAALRDSGTPGFK